MYRRDVLPNGIRVITETVPHARTTSIGFWIHAGSRWEETETAGISHVLEHMLFKGTASRSARDIAEEIDSLGGRLNAFTDKEATCYYAKVLGEHLPIAIDVLSDMLLRSVFDADELERERNVILEEIKQREDDPEELVHDILAETIWPDHPLGRAVIGLPETVGALDRNRLIEYLDRWYAPDRIVVTASGLLDPEDVLDRVASSFGGLPVRERAASHEPPIATPGERRVTRDVEQVNLCIGAPGIAQTSDDRYALACLDVAFGGGMSSRLFQEIREKRGLAYSIGSYFLGYHGGGMFAVFAGTSAETMDEVLAVIREETDRLREEGLTEAELDRAKNQIKGSMLMGLESMSTRMSRLGKTEIYFNRVIPIEEALREMEAVTLEEVQRVAREILAHPPTLAAIGPFHE